MAAEDLDPFVERFEMVDLGGRVGHLVGPRELRRLNPK
jgi:hypothetical protein